jgi:hypothetical protein
LNETWKKAPLTVLGTRTLTRIDVDKYQEDR